MQLTYKIGSVEGVRQGENFVVPSLQWIGMQHEDIVRDRISDHALQPLSAADHKKIASLRKSAFFMVRTVSMYSRTHTVLYRG